MRSMANIDYSLVSKELKPLEGGRLDKLYDMENNEFRLRFRASGRYEDVCVKLGERIHLTKYIRDAPKEPSNLAMHLRKRLVGAKLASVGQYDFDRVIVFTFLGEEEFSLVFEMFAEGNVILFDKSGKTVRCLRREEWKDRIIREGKEYAFPSSDRLSPPFSADSLRSLSSEKSIISVLVSRTNFGNEYLEEGCRRAGIEPKRKSSDLSEKDFAILSEELNRILLNPAPRTYLKEGKPFDYSITKLSKHSELESRDASSLSEAVDECANAGTEGQTISPEQSEKRKKLELRLAKQEERMGEMLRESEELKKKGDGIYSRYGEVESILKSIKEMRKSGRSWEEVKKSLEGKCRIDEKRGTVSVD